MNALTGRIVAMIRNAVLAGAVLAAISPGAPGAETDEAWPPEDFLIESLVKGVEGIMNTYHPETGRFGNEPWICLDQNHIFPLAVAWATKHPDNPYYHDDEILQAIAKGGEVLVDEMDENGKWIFRKKDNSTWGQIYMPWTYSRWIRAYHITRDALPEASREKWEKGLRLGYGKLAALLPKMRVHNIPTHHGMSTYIAGVAFDNPDWQRAGREMIHRAVEHQDPGGFWSENSGPVVTYNRVYVEALGIYYDYSRDPVVLETLKRSAKFHAAILYPDGSAASCIDERVVYHGGVDMGNVGFSWTPEGRGFLLAQLPKYRTNETRLANADYAAAMIRHGGEGKGIMPPAAGDRGTVALGDNDALIRRYKPWQWVLSAYATEPIDNRWIQDRHNLVEVFHDDMGVVAGGGNTKLQPYWSTFTLGDTSALKHKKGETHPDFTPDIDLRWTPDEAEIASAADSTELRVKMGEVRAAVRTQVRDDGSLRLTYTAPQGKRVEAHLPLMRRHGIVKTADKTKHHLSDDNAFVLSSDRVGDHFTLGDLRVSMPQGASLKWPALQHNPYARDGKAPIGNAKVVVVMPFDDTDRYDIDLAYEPEPPFPGLAYDARNLPIKASEKAFTKPLDMFDSQLLGRCPVGEYLVFTLPDDIAPGKYELYGEFVLAPMYGIVEVRHNGKAVGEPFDAWAPSVDAVGERVRFGVVDIAQGANEITLKIVGKSEKSDGNIVSVKRWLLKPLDK